VVRQLGQPQVLAEAPVVTNGEFVVTAQQWRQRAATDRSAYVEARRTGTHPAE
jgi:hypothetical protein